MNRILKTLFTLTLLILLIGCQKTTTTVTTVDPAAYQIANGGFETGDLTGWTVTSGTAFNRLGVTSATSFDGTVPYGKDGDYLYGVYAEQLVGTMISDPFVIGGTGYLTFRLGGCYNEALTYLSIVDAETGIEYFRFGNPLFNRTDDQTDPTGYFMENLVPYYYDLSSRMGETVILKVVDESTQNDGYVTLDDVVTYHPTMPELSAMHPAEDCKPVFADAAGTPNVLFNADFAIGTLFGWTVVGETDSFRTAHLNAAFRLSNRSNETAAGVLRSSAFKVGGTGLLSFRMGATKHPELTYLSIRKVGTNVEVFRTYSDRWVEADEENTHLYYVDLYAYQGECLYVELVDNARGDWGLISFEDLDTFWESYPAMTDEVARNLLVPVETAPAYAAMRAYVNPLIATIADADERLTFQKTFYATIDGVSNRVGTWASVMEYETDGSTFIRTGDIEAMWLRDSSAQVLAYLQFMAIDPDVQGMVKGLLKKQFELIRRDPYANAFHQNGSVFERKFEVDSLTYPFWLALQYYEITGDGSIFDAFFLIALDRAVTTLENEQNHSDANYAITNSYDQNAGQNAFAPDCGLVWSGYRPSDDVTYYRYNIPQNMFAAATFGAVADLLATIGRGETLALRCDTLSSGIRQGIETYGTYDDPTYGTLWVFETDGTNADAASNTHKLLMDAANIPSLLSAPWLGFCETDDETYLNTRAFILSTDNP
ncbi:MAG: glycoside hydrolase family 125 protein, partial [Bacillota bacterium]|nr:glycoside hydrolase family 125 protein [Bacillota bacterium]